MEFIISKLFWVFFMPGNFFVLLLLLGAFLAVSHNKGRRQAGRRLCFCVALLLFLIAIFPVGSWGALPLENRFPPEVPAHVDGIIILGGDEQTLISEKRSQPDFMDSGRRYIMFAALARKYPNAKLIFTGGTGMIAPEAKVTQSEVAKEALADAGVPIDHMLFEDRSHNTHENAVMTAALVHPTPQQNWLLVTSALHMPRAMLCFRKAGWNVYPAPAGYFTDGQFSSRLRFDLTDHLNTMTYGVREYYGLIA